jgi:hypothetical protein
MKLTGKGAGETGKQAKGDMASVKRASGGSVNAKGSKK